MNSVLRSSCSAQASRLASTALDINAFVVFHTATPRPFISIVRCTSSLVDICNLKLIVDDGDDDSVLVKGDPLKFQLLFCVLACGLSTSFQLLPRGT